MKSFIALLLILGVIHTASGEEPQGGGPCDTLLTMAFEYWNDFYVPDRCAENIARLLDELWSYRYDMSTLEVLILIPPGYPDGSLLPRFPRRSFRTREKVKSNMKWDFHVVMRATKENEQKVILDFDTHNQPQEIEESRYFGVFFPGQRVEVIRLDSLYYLTNFEDSPSIRRSQGVSIQELIRRYRDSSETR